MTIVIKNRSVNIGGQTFPRGAVLFGLSPDVESALMAGGDAELLTNLGNPVKQALPQEIHLFANPDLTTRLFEFVVPRGQTKMTFSLFGCGGSGGAGNPLTDANRAAGGGGSCAETIQRLVCDVTPGARVYGCLGGPGVDVYLKHTSHSGTRYLQQASGRGIVTAVALPGAAGAAGTNASSGAGGAAVGTFLGRTNAATPAGKTTTSQAGTNATAFSGAAAGVSPGAMATRLPLRPQELEGYKCGGAVGSGGAYLVAADIGTVTVTGGFGANLAIVGDGTVGIDGLSGQRASAAGSTTVPGAGAGANALQSTLHANASGAGGSATLRIGADAQGPACGAGGGTPGYPGGIGFAHMIIHDWAGPIEDAPLSREFPCGAGIVVPSTFFGYHAKIGVNSTNNCVANTTTNKVQLSIERPWTEQRQVCVFTAGTLPVVAGNRQLAIGTPYYVLPFGPFATSATSHNYVGLSFTDGGPALDFTTAGSGLEGQILDVPAAGFEYSLHRTLFNTFTHWAALHVSDGSFNAPYVALCQKLRTWCLATGRKLVWVIIGTPDSRLGGTMCTVQWANAGPTATNYAANGQFGAQEAPVRTVLGDGRNPIRQFTNWLVTNFADVLHAIEVGNEPSFGVTTGFYNGSAADLVQMAVDVKAELTAMGSAIPIWSAGMGSGSSVKDAVLSVGATLGTYMTATATVTGTKGADVGWGAIVVHPYDVTSLSIPPAGAAIGPADMAPLANGLRRALQQFGVANWATVPIVSSEVGINIAGSTLTRYPHADIARLTLGRKMAAMLTGFSADISYAFGQEHDGLTGRDDAYQQLMGDLHRTFSGKTITAGGMRGDGAWVVTTQQGGATTWSPYLTLDA